MTLRFHPKTFFENNFLAFLVGKTGACANNLNPIPNTNYDKYNDKYTKIYVCDYIMENV